MTKLNVPYRSQWDADARTHSADCGPTCVAMVLNYHSTHINPDQIYDHLPPKEKDEFTNFSELITVIKGFNIDASYKNYGDRNRALTGLRNNIDGGKPMIALVKYAPWRELTGNIFDWGHFVVVTGYDNANIYFNDPLFGNWKVRSLGEQFAMTHDQFCAGWGGFPLEENPNWVCTIIDSVDGTSSAPEPVATPAPPVATRPAQATLTETMADVNLRIRALATYRRAEMPNLADAVEAKLWQDHLGDWGLTYDQYAVQSGDTLSGLAIRYFEEQHRWPAIKEYNNLSRDGLWVGETILVPHMGQSGAQTTDALPSDNISSAKSLLFEDLIDPDLAALDYNALGSKSVGMGFMPVNDSN